MTARPVGDGDGQDGLRGLLTSTLRGCVYPVDLVGVTEHLLPHVTAYAERVARQRAAEELRAAAMELHVARFNADDDPEARWPVGAPQVAPDTFYRGISVAELALKFRADALAADVRTGGRA